METREKQAYLIEAHKCDEMLLTLLRMLDVPWNDIFIHMDSTWTAKIRTTSRKRWSAA